MSEALSHTLSEDIAAVTTDNPPVNAANQSVRAGLKQAFSGLRGKPEIKAIALGCAGGTFDAVQAALGKPFDEGLRFESALSAKREQATESRAR